MQKSQNKIVLIGGPGTGKTSVINELIKRDYFCMPEISRQVTLKAQEKGIDQLFLTEPLLFSKMLLEGREQQFITADKSDEKLVFFDRGIPDVIAYMEYFKSDYPSFFTERSAFYKYDKIFHFSPWDEIHTTDNERYETFEQSIAIDKFLTKAYTDLGYSIINIPFGTIEERTDFVIHSHACDL